MTTPIWNVRGKETGRWIRSFFPFSFHVDNSISSVHPDSLFMHNTLLLLSVSTVISLAKGYVYICKKEGRSSSPIRCGYSHAPKK